MRRLMWSSVIYRKWTSKIFYQNSAMQIVTGWLASQKYSFFHFAGEWLVFYVFKRKIQISIFFCHIFQGYYIWSRYFEGKQSRKRSRQWQPIAEKWGIQLANLFRYENMLCHCAGLSIVPWSRKWVVVHTNHVQHLVGACARHTFGRPVENGWKFGQCEAHGRIKIANVQQRGSGILQNTVFQSGLLCRKKLKCFVHYFVFFHFLILKYFFTTFYHVNHTHLHIFIF